MNNTLDDPALPVRRAVEEQALMYAKREIMRYASGGNPWGDAPVLSRSASDDFMRQFLRRVALEHPLHRMRLIEWARTGYDVVHEVLATLIIEIKSRGEPLPVELAGFDMEITRSSFTGRRRTPAPKKTSNLIRDITIALVVAGVCDRFRPTIKPTSTSKTRRSACWIVAEALGDAGMKISEAAVVKIWQRLGGAMPTCPGWA